MNPRTYFFWRPFETNQPKMGARRLNGIHFSMADHRRDYEILGMEPAKTRRNTYRLEPTPWDTNLVDYPPEDNTPANRGTVPGEASHYSTRSWRLT
jgi:hypothetical protein